MRGIKVLIFCAGNGTRLKPLTDKIPKPMVYVGGKPVLEHIVSHLNRYGIKEIIVNLHYKPKPIMEYFGNRLLYFYEPILLGEKETERRLYEMGWLGETYVCMNGDTLTDINIKEMYERGLFNETSNHSISSFDNGVYTGTKFVIPKTEVEKVNFGCYWQDMGTPTGLAKAREHYA